MLNLQRVLVTPDQLVFAGKPNLQRGLLLALLLALAPSVAAIELRGFPVDLAEKVDTSSPAIADITGDGHLDIAICTATKLVVLDNSGAPVDGFPVVLFKGEEQTDLKNTASPVICDLQGNGRQSIVVASPNGRLHVFDKNGVERPGWPQKLGALAPASAVCVDLDRNGNSEIVVVTEKGKIKIFTASGEPYSGFKQPKKKMSPSVVAVVDLKPGKSKHELVFGSPDGKLYAYDSRGRSVKGFPFKTDYAISAGASAGDVDGDGDWDLVFGSQDFGIYAVSSDGKVKDGFPVKAGYRIYGGAALGDITGDGVADIVVGGADGKVYAVRGDGKTVPGWPVDTKARVYSTPAIADVDRDGAMEVLVTSSDGRLHVFRARGRKLPGFPVRVGGELRTSPYVVDLDGNGSLEAIVASGGGKLHAYSFVPVGRVPVAEVAWAGYGQDYSRVSRHSRNRGTFLDLALSPKKPRTDDDLVASYKFKDLDGDVEKDTQIRWFRNGRLVKEYDNKKRIPSSATKKAESWHFTLQEGHDFVVFGKKRGAHIHKIAPVRISNTAPGRPEVVFRGKQQRTTDPLVVEVTKPASDPDGDKIRYRIRWLRDREQVREVNGAFKVSEKLTRKGQQWEALVIPFDGVFEGEAARIATTILNTPPRTPKVSLLPGSPKVTQDVAVRIDKGAFDADFDKVSYRYRWFVDGKVRPIADTVSQLPASITSKAHKISVEVTPVDDEQSGKPARAEVVVVNTPPPSPTVQLVPTKPRTGDDLIARIVPPSADVDGDTVTYTLKWLRGNKVLEGHSGPRIPAKMTQKGERYFAKVTPADDSSKGKTAFAEVQIVNTPPGAAAVSVSPMQPRAGDALQAQITDPAVDADGDKLFYRWAWLRDGTEVSGLNADRVPPGVVKKGEVWRAKVIASDKIANGPAGVCDIRIVDTPPGAPQIAVHPKKPSTSQVVEAKVLKAAVDTDGDTVSYLYSWSLNGVEQDLPADVPRLDAKLTRRGQRWQLVVTPVADGVTGKSMAASFVIADTAPKQPAVVITPAQPRTDDDLVALVPKLPADIDGDPVTVKIWWLKNGQPAGIEGGRVAASSTRRGETWMAVAQASDGTLKSEKGRSEVLIANSPPSPPRVSIARRIVRTDQVVAVKIDAPASDIDGDPVVLQYRWLRDGKKVELTGQPTSIAVNSTAKGQRWRVVVTPNDGKVDGQPVVVPFEVENTPPGKPTIHLVPAKPRTTEPLLVKIDAPAPDADGDKLEYRYRWFKDGVRQRAAPESGRMAAKHTRRGERWRVEVRAFDGEQEGPAATSRVRIGNSTPGQAKIRVEPAQPKTHSKLQCQVTQPAQDPDKEKLIYRFFWQRDGKPVPEGVDGVIPAPLVQLGQQWSCLAEATDGELTGPRVQSAVVKVVNSAPSQPKIAIYPEHPRSGEALHCAVTQEAIDLDGNPVTYQFEWRKGKSKKSLHRGLAILPEGTGKKGDRWTCRVSATDGKLSSKNVSTAVAFKNSPPKAPTVKLVPEHPIAQIDKLRCEVGTTALDPDGDRVKYTVHWFQDGVQQNFAPTNLEVPAKLVADKSLWQCTVTVSDGKGSSPLAKSNTVLVGAGDSAKP